MRFHISEEQDLLQDTLRRTLVETCPPDRRRRLLASNSDFDKSLWEALAEVGFHGLMIPEAYGGSGLGVLDAALATEVLGEAAACGPFMTHILASFALTRYADEALKQRWLARLNSGAACATIAIGDGWTPETWTSAVCEGRLNGEVRFVCGADQAALFVVGVAGGGLVVVESNHGVEIRGLEVSDMTRRLWTVCFRDAPCLTLTTDFASGQSLLDASLVLLAADALGGAQRCLALSVDHAMTRRQFGVPIGQFQAIKHQLADMALQIEPARALLWYAAHAQDAGLEDASRVAAHAKAHMADRFVSVARSAVQVHGGIGYSWDYDLQLWFRRSLFDRAYMGSPSLHRERVASIARW